MQPPEIGIFDPAKFAYERIPAAIRFIGKKIGIKTKKPKEFIPFSFTEKKKAVELARKLEKQKYKTKVIKHEGKYYVLQKKRFL